MHIIFNSHITLDLVCSKLHQILHKLLIIFLSKSVAYGAAALQRPIATDHQP